MNKRLKDSLRFEDITRLDDIIQKVNENNGWTLENFIIDKDLYIILLQKFINTLQFTSLEDFRGFEEPLSYKGIPIYQSQYEGYSIKATITIYDYYFGV